MQSCCDFSFTFIGCFWHSQLGNFIYFIKIQKISFCFEQNSPKFIFAISTYALALLIRFFFPCLFGNEKQYDYGKLLGEIYNINWIKARKNERKNFLIIQENLKPIFQLKAAKILQINLITYLRIFQSAYSMNTVLRELKK